MCFTFANIMNCSIATILISLWLAFGASCLLAGDISKEARESIYKWASKNEKSLISDDGVRIISKNIPEDFIEAKVLDRDIGNRNVVYYDPESHRIYFDIDTTTLHSDDRASIMTTRFYAKLKEDKSVTVITKKAIMHRSVMFKTTKGAQAAPSNR
jgi:uncharacterized protein YprB with RNaseH-like and TPR domain